MLGRPSYLMPIVLAVCLATNTYGELVARWPLSGNVQDVVHSHHGELVGDAAFVQDPERGTVLQVDGTSGHVLIPHADHIGFIEDRNFSIALWVKPASLPRTTWTTVLAKNRDIHYNNAYGIWISPENQWHFRFGAASGNANQPNAPAATAQWNHLAMTHDPATTTLRGYLNGVLVYQNTAASPGTLGNTALWIGGAGGVSEFYPGLVHEVQIYNHALTVEEIQDVMLGVGMETELAGDPRPADSEDDVPVDSVLHWTAGEFAATHDVYLGTTFADVNEASRAMPMGVLVSQDQTGTMFDPGPLEFGKTYHWRIDEVNSAPDFSVFKGNVWSFTTEPLAYPVQDVVATSNGITEAGAGPENTVDGSGLEDGDRHSIAAADMWLADPPADGALYIRFEFDRVYKLHEMVVWNYNVQFELVLGFGLKDVTVEYSTDGEDWLVLGDVELAKATARADYVANTVVDFEGAPARFVRLTVNSGHGAMGQFGLSEVRFLYIPAHAREPQPADGATDIDPETALSWRAGREAVSHEVYLGSAPDVLSLVDSVAAPRLAPADLELGGAYYWRVDEVNEADAVTTWVGDVWSFSVRPYLVIDDMESYTDDIDGAETIFDTWTDGWVNGTGSVVGYFDAPFAEQTLVHSGRQSMPLEYDNTASPNYSETTRTFDSPQDWTAHGVQSLSLYFRGRAGNTGRLYLRIDDAKVSYDGDAADIGRAVWQVWNVDLSTVGADLQSVTSLTIGIEGLGTAGLVFIDDIRLYPQAVERITPVEPDAANLVAHYTLDGNVNDSSGHGYHGTVMGAPTYVAGVEGQAILLGGNGDYVDFGTPAGWPSGLAPRTMTAWGRTSSTAAGWRWIAAYGTGAASQAMFIGLNGADLYAGGHGDDVMVPGFWDVDEWHHVGLTYDGATARLYADGVEVASVPKDWNLVPDRAHIGRQVSDQIEFWTGSVDEVRIYDEALSAAQMAWLAGRRSPVYRPF